MFEATYQLKSLGKFSTFAEAFKAIYDAVKSDEQLSWQILESTTWIESDAALCVLPTMFYEAKDRMCKEGYLVNGKWVGK